MAEFIPPLFKNFGKGLRDLFKEQFEYKKSLKVKSATSNGVTLETTGEALKGGDYSGEVKATYKQADIGTFEAELKTSGATKYSVKADKLTKGLVIKASGDEKPAGKLEVDYSKDFFAVSDTVEVSRDSTSVEAAGVVGFDGLSTGGSVKYDVTGQQLSDYNAGVEYTQSDFTGTVKTANQADRVELSFLHKVSGDLTLGGLFSYDLNGGKRVLTAGGAYKIDDANNSKLKADSDGVLSAVLEHRLRKASAKVLLSSEFNLRNQSTTPERFGVGIVFGDD